MDIATKIIGALGVLGVARGAMGAWNGWEEYSAGKRIGMIRRLNKAGLVCFMELLLQLYQQELQQVLLHF